MLNSNNFPGFNAEIENHLFPKPKKHATMSGACAQSVAVSFGSGQNRFREALKNRPIPLDNETCKRIAAQFKIDQLGDLPHRLAHWPLPRHFELTSSERLNMWREECTDAFERKVISATTYDAVGEMEPYLRPAGGGNWFVCGKSPVPLSVCAKVLTPAKVIDSPDDLSVYHSERGAHHAACHEGLRALRDGRFEEAVVFFKVAAQEKDAMALFQLGWLAEDGKGCRRDMAAAVTFYEAAAEAGSVVAHQNLGSIFCVENQDFPQDMPRAIRHFETAAKAGLTAAMSSLGRILWHGTGVPREPDRARELLKSAASGGDAHAFNTLAVINEQEHGTDSYELNFKMYREAVRQAHVNENPLPTYNLATYYLEGKGTAKNPRMARLLFRRAAAAGDLDAQFTLGRMAFCEPDGPNYPKSLAWFERAAEQGHPDAMFLLGRVLMSGQAGVLEYERGEQMLNDAARMGHVGAASLVSDLAAGGAQ
jgi:TPR repeat protein